MSHKKRRLELEDNPYLEDEPTTKKRKIHNPYLDPDEWWKGKSNQEGTTDQGKNDLIDYFANIDYMISNESFDNDESEQMFINNIIKEMERFNDTIFIFEHPEISKVIEKIVQILPSFYIIQFIKKFVLPNLLVLITKKCSSHVLQTLFSLIPRILIEQHSVNETGISEMGDLLTQIIAKLQEYEPDNHGLSQLFISEISTFVLRDLLWISCGVVRFNKNKKKHRMKLHNVRKIPTLKKFSLDHVPLSVVKLGSIITADLLKYKDKYPLSAHIKQNMFCRDKHSNILCGSLGVLIECLFITKSNAILQELIDEILRPPPPKKAKQKKINVAEKDRIKKHICEMIMDESASHLIQSIFEFGNKNVSLFVFKNYLNAKDIREIALNDNGNFVLQSMLRRLFDIKSIQFVASSLQNNIIELFNKNKIGVLYCLLDAFTRKHLKPNAMVKAILNEINNVKVDNNNDEKENDNIIYKFLYLNLNENKRKKHLIRSKIMALSSQYSVLGSLLLQSIIKCNSDLSEPVYKALLVLDVNEIVKICKDSSGSHVIQSFIESKYIFGPIKWQFLSKIEDKFATLCTDKFGNYIMESTFFCLDFPFKEQFALKLLDSESTLKGSRIGLMLYVKMKLGLLKSDDYKWRRTIMKHKKHFRKTCLKIKKHKTKNSDKKNKTKPKNNKHYKNSQNYKNIQNRAKKLKKTNKLF